MHLTVMQRVYFLAGAAPLVVAAFFGGATGEAGATNLLACVVTPRADAAAMPASVTEADAASTPTGGDEALPDRGSYGY